MAYKRDLSKPLAPTFGDDKPKRKVRKTKVRGITKRKEVTKKDGTTVKSKNISSRTSPGFDGKVKSKEKRDADGNLIKFKEIKGGWEKDGTKKTIIKTKKRAKDEQATVKRKTKTLSGTKKSKWKKSKEKTSKLRV